MVVIILDGKLNIKQDGQTKNGSEGYSGSISGTFLVTSGQNPRINHE